MNTLLIAPPEKELVTTRKTSGDDRLQRQSVAAPRARILYVDDDDEIRRLGRDVLERQGYKVDMAADGQEGLEALLAGHHQLLITDHNMPHMTGLELVIKARKAGLRLPIVMTSGFAYPSQIPNQVRSSITALLPKPFAATDLLSNVVQILNNNKSTGLEKQAPGSIERIFYEDQSYRHWGINE